MSGAGLEEEAVAPIDAPACDVGGCGARGSRWTHDGSWLCEQCHAVFLRVLEQERGRGSGSFMGAGRLKGNRSDRQLRP